MTSPDQTPPKELKNPIHLETSGLVFNQKTGDARTKKRVDFRISQATGLGGRRELYFQERHADLRFAGRNCPCRT